MTDPVLCAHEVDAQLFSIAGELSPASIRDQILRACMLVDRALENEVIGVERPLLVIGAGAAGVAAAIRALAYDVDVRVVVVEANKDPFAPQEGCNTRWIDPNQYDWPSHHWRQESFPAWGAPVPLGWTAGTAASLVNAWSEVFKRHCRRVVAPLDNEFVYIPDVRVLRWHVDGDVQMLFFSQAEGRELEQAERNALLLPFGMVLVCTGAGREDCVVRRGPQIYRGTEFWENDRFEDAAAGCSFRSAPVRIVVSGSGDGALQDYVRVVTGQRSCKAVLEALFRSPEALAVLGSVTQRIFRAEEFACRALIWGGAKAHDHYVLSELEGVYIDAIEGLRDDPRVWGGIDEQLSSWFKARRLESVHIAHSCTHFRRCYPLNRFVALLLVRWLLERQDSLPRFRGVGIGCVECESPAECSMVALDWDRVNLCHGKLHRVSFVGRECIPSSRSGIGEWRARFELVIVRHGLGKGGRDADTRGWRPEIRLIRQLLPYHLPEHQMLGFV